MGFSFNNLPINTLVGADRATFDSVVAHSKIDSAYRNKFRLTKSCQRVLNPLYTINKSEFSGITKPEIQSPVFIIGHWRSGTTFVHNLLSKDPQFGYCTTYQTVFPHLMLYGSSLFKRLAALCMPAARPTDSMELSIDQPQEEEFAIANMTHASFYHFWLFPSKMAQLRERYLLFDSATEAERQSFCNAVVQSMQIALHCQQKGRFLSKNPPHTARIKMLKKLFPDAKFIYLMRNPYTVFESSCNFFSKTLEAISLQQFSTAELESEILKTYCALYNRYNAEKSVIPKSDIVEVRFEDFEADPLNQTKRIYQSLNLGDFNSIQGIVKNYADSQKNFHKNHYNYRPSTLDLINHNCPDALHNWDYTPLG